MDELSLALDVRTHERVIREELLLEFLRHLEPRKDAQRGAHIALSRLSPINRRQSHLRLAIEGLSRLAKSGQGQLFQLCNNDLLFFHQASTEAAVKTELARLRILFAEDPLLQGVEDAAGFCRVYDLDRDFSSVVKLARAQPVRRRSGIETPALGSEGTRAHQQRREHARQPVPPKFLPKINAILARTELSNFIRRHPVVRLAADSRPHSLFNELSVSLQALSEAIVPGLDLAAERNIVRFLTRTLERRILTMLSGQEAQHQRHHVAIPTSLSTLFSETFRAFDAQISMRRRGSIVLKVSLADIISDMDAARFVFRLARHRGYRTLLLADSPPTVPLLTLEGLGIDFVRCDCNASLNGRATPVDQLAEVSRCLAPARLVLSGIDSNAALALGLRAGIELFQGAYVDRMPRGAAAQRPQLSDALGRGEAAREWWHS